MSANRHFNALARGLHWLMAVLILAMLFIGAGMVASLQARPWLIALHRPLGLAILLLALLRLGNRLRHAPPPLPADLPRWQAIAARASHVVLYALMLVLPVLGWAVLSAGGYPVTLFGDVQLPALVPADATLYALLRLAHGWLARLLFLVVLAHLSAALFHAWVRRDGVFASMARGPRAAPPPAVDAAVATAPVAGD
ncbi:cytochrome b [Tahibacter caeni]|uniref:cytochrome b n=1 Tax=Tahibacter caeni TaxID=1453545 RepID=UPI0021475049|nr:cytochrome b/b6 domain-containing protein [Tahibacter caeni]